MRHRDRPQRVGRPVDEPKCFEPQSLPQQAGDDDDDQQVERDGAQALPQRAVVAEERDHEVDQAQLGVGVHEQQPHVQRDEKGCGQGDEAVHVGDREARQHDQRPAGPGGDAEGHRDGHEGQGDDAVTAAQRPQSLTGHEPRETVTCGEKLLPPALPPPIGTWLCRIGNAEEDLGACCTGACCGRLCTGAWVYLRGVGRLQACTWACRSARAPRWRPDRRGAFRAAAVRPRSAAPATTGGAGGRLTGASTTAGATASGAAASTTGGR